MVACTLQLSTAGRGVSVTAADEHKMVCSAGSQSARVGRAAPERPPNGSRQRMFIFGLGYTGLAVANQLQQHGWCGDQLAFAESCFVWIQPPAAERPA